MKKQEKLPQQSASISARDLVALTERIHVLVSTSGIALDNIEPELKSDVAKRSFEILKANLSEVEKYYRSSN